MLGNSRVHPVLLAKDLAQAREFNHDKVGLEIIVENGDRIEFRCGGGTKLAVSKGTTGTSDSQTQIGWEVDDLRAELDELRDRGVTVEDYDLRAQDGKTGSPTLASPGWRGSWTRARMPSRSSS